MFWMILRLLGLDTVLGLVLARNEQTVETPEAETPALETPAETTATPAESVDATMARQLEEANRRIAELQALSEDKIRREAEALVHEIFPEAEAPPDPYEGRRGYARPEDYGDAPPERDREITGGAAPAPRPRETAWRAAATAGRPP